MDLAAHTKLGRAVQRGLSGTAKVNFAGNPLVRMILSQLVIWIATRAVKLGDDPMTGISSQLESRKPRPSRHRFEKPIHNVKNLAVP
jgi:hypothetical protein